MILAINTSTPQFGLALMEDDGTVLAEYFMSKEKGFGSLMPALHFLLSKLNADIHALKAIVVSTGPGSFTGLRVGLSSAKGLCHALKIPIIGIPSLEALASQIPYSDLPITPVLYSRKRELFTAQFIQKDGYDLTRRMDDMALKIDDLSSIFKKPSCFIGNDFINQSELLKEALGPIVHLAPPNFWNLRPSSVGALGLKRFGDNDVDIPQMLEPIYLRPPDIRPNPFPPMADPFKADSTDR